MIRDTPIQTSSQPGMMRFKPFLGDQDYIEPPLSLHNLSRKYERRLRIGVPLAGTELLFRSRVRATTAKMRQLFKG